MDKDQSKENLHAEEKPKRAIPESSMREEDKPQASEKEIDGSVGQKTPENKKNPEATGYRKAWLAGGLLKRPDKPPR